LQFNWVVNEAKGGKGQSRKRTRGQWKKKINDRGAAIQKGRHRKVETNSSQSPDPSEGKVEEEGKKTKNPRNNRKEE